MLTGLLVLTGVHSQIPTLHAQGTAFTYQGRLEAGSVPATGLYDLQFNLHGAASGGGTLTAGITSAATPVTNGLFTVTLDFGNQFPGADRWLEIAARTNGGGAFSTLAPRQKLTATPYAITAGNVTGTVAAGQLTGAIAPSQLPPGVVTNGATGLNLSGNFTGNGAGITNVTVDQLQQEIGFVIAWGANTYGQTTVPSSLNDVVAIAGGGAHSLALRSDGTVTAWGNNNRGQTNVPAGLSNVVAIAGGTITASH